MDQVYCIRSPVSQVRQPLSLPNAPQNITSLDGDKTLPPPHTMLIETALNRWFYTIFWAATTMVRKDILPEQNISYLSFGQNRN
jgi:hypothetical protein